MTLIAGRYQPFEAARPGTPQRARDLQTAQTVLLREVPVADAGGAALTRARAAQGICHPSLVTLFDVVEQPDGRLLLAYEFVPAQSIAQAGGGQPFHPRRAVAVVTEVADAVAELHAHDVIHGGISQLTVLLTMKGKAKLDRVGDPSLGGTMPAEASHDLAALGQLLEELAGRRTGGGVAGAQAIEAIVARARAGRFDSAATLAALLRRV